MLYPYLFLLFSIIQFDSQCYVQAQELAQECYAFGDPHVYTWHTKGSGYTSQKYQDCYTPGYSPVVQNEFISYKAKISRRWMVETEMFFYNGTSKHPLCLITSSDFEMYTDDDAKCLKYGITWNMARTTTNYVMSVSYMNANFFTTIQFDYISRTYAPHYTIHVWQPATLATRSTGFCTQSDPDCNPTHRAVESELENENIPPPTRTFTNSQAKTICQTYVNAYLGRSRRAPHQRSASTNDTIANALVGCEADVIFTGQPEAVRSSVNILMIDELVSDVTSINSIQTAVESGVGEALAVLNDVVEKTQIEVSKLLDLTSVAPIETTSTPTTAPEVLSTTTVPTLPFKCGVFQDMYIQTWHPINQVLPPTRDCFGTSANFQLVGNEYVEYTLHTNGSTIDELTLVLFEQPSGHAICNITALGQVISWMDCEQNGINPSLVTTATHEQLTVSYAPADFTTVVTRDVGVFYGRFNIIVHLKPELAFQSPGICNLASSCAAT